MESIIVKLKPKSQIQKKPERKKHDNNQGGAKKVMQDIGNDIWICNDSRNQFGNLEFYQHQIQQQEQFQQQQQLTDVAIQQMREQCQFPQRLQQDIARMREQGHQMSR